MRSGPSPLSCRVFLPLPLLQAFPLLVAGHVLPLLPSLASLFIYSSVRDFPSPPLRHSGHPTLFATYLFLLLLLIIQGFFFFFPWVGVSLSRGLCWSGPGLSVGVPHAACWPCDLRLPKQSGCWRLVTRDPSWFLCLTWSGDAMRRLRVRRSQSFDSSGGFSCKVYLQCLSKILL
jgi:hypothetical protein